MTPSAAPLLANASFSTMLSQVQEYLVHLVSFYRDPTHLTSSLDAFLLVLGVLLGIGASAITFRIPFKELLWATAAGFLGWETMYCLSQFDFPTLSATTLGAFMVSITAEILARDRRAPATIYVVPGILPLVPGRAIYNTMLNSLNGENTLARDGGVQALFGAGGIAIGMLLGTAIARGLMHSKRLQRNSLEHELQRHLKTHQSNPNQERRNRLKAPKKGTRHSIREISQNVEERFTRFLDNAENAGNSSTSPKRAKELLGKLEAKRKKVATASQRHEMPVSAPREALNLSDSQEAYPTPAATKHRRKK